MKYPLVALAGLLFSVAFAVPASAAPVVPEDLFRLTLVDSAALSPDGAYVLMETSRSNGPKNRYDRTIDLVNVATARTTANVTGRTADGDFAWTPDGSAFVFVRSMPKKKPQLYRYTIATKKIMQLTNIANGVSGPNFSHDGRHIVVTVTESDPAPNAHVDFTKAGFTPTADEKKSDIRTIDALFFETNGQGFTYQDHPHIWTVDADGSHPKQLTSGKWGEGFVGWSPDDRTIAFNSLQRESVDGGADDVYVMPSTGGTPQKIASMQQSNNGLSYLSTGELAWLRGGVQDNAEQPELVISDTSGNQRVAVAKNTTGWGDSLLADMKEGGGLCGAPLPDGNFVLNVDGPGYSNIRTLDTKTGTFSNVTPPRGEAWSCSTTRDGKSVAYLYSDFTHPADVWISSVSGGTPRQLTNVNAAWLAHATLSTPQEFSVQSTSGRTVQAWFMPAIGGSGPHPTLLNIHGGPETQFGDTFFLEFQYYAGLGYNVVFSDPAGSTGHGYAVTEALENDYGDAMFQDTQSVMDESVKRPDVDPNRLGVTGGSYGGYATLWVITHTNRYKAAAAERVVSFLQSENLDADFAGKGGLGGGQYVWGPAWDPASTSYAKFSPLTYVANVQTPLLLLHSELDTRTPIDQTLQFFTSLKILGRTVTYVDVPSETHDLSRTGSPIHRVERMHLLADWFARYLKT
ncbi:MAG: S9 family peptidase [Candidatus Tumulicola sp.]